MEIPNKVFYEYEKLAQLEPGEPQNVYFSDYSVAFEHDKKYGILINKDGEKIDKIDIPDWLISERQRYYQYAQVYYEELYKQCINYLESRYIHERPDTENIEYHDIPINEMKDRGLTVSIEIINNIDRRYIAVEGVVFFDSDNRQIYAVVDENLLELELNYWLPTDLQSVFYIKHLENKVGKN